MTTYVEKPVEYDVKQWNGTIEGAQEIAEFVARPGDFIDARIAITEDSVAFSLGLDQRPIRKGDWVLKSLRGGGFHVVSDTTFTERYWQLAA